MHPVGRDLDLRKIVVSGCYISSTLGLMKLLLLDFRIDFISANLDLQSCNLRVTTSVD